MIMKYTALFLLVLVAASEAKSDNLVNGWLRLKQLYHGRLFEEGVTANINEYLDETISLIIPFIQQNGLDPMPLPDIEEGFRVRPILITYSGQLKLYDGHLDGLVHVARSGDQKLSYFDKMLRARVQLQFNDLKVNYNYLVKLMNIGPRGKLQGTLNHFVIVFDVILDFNKDEIVLQDFKLTNNGNLKVHLSGNWLTDWLVNAILSLFTRIFNSNIMNAVQSNIKVAIEKSICGINQNLQETIQRLESFNN